MDPRHFVDIRTVPGGPSLEAMRPALETRDVKAWIAAKDELFQTYPRLIKDACRADTLT
jgi:hypothetical protein